MSLKVAEVTELTRARTLAAFAATTEVLQERLQPAVRRSATFSRQAANVFSEFLGPAAVLALVLGLWRLTADLGWTGDFVIANGLFSHWQTWIALAVGIRFSASLVNSPDPAVIPRRKEDPSANIRSNRF